MALHLTGIHASKACRAIYAVSTLLVFSYILFEVLDLDGSDFPLKQSALERAAIVADVAKDPLGAYSAEKIARPGDLFLVSPNMDCGPRRACLTRALTLSSLNSTRNHGYRIALPRSSPPDPLRSL